MQLVRNVAKLSQALGIYPALRSFYHTVSPSIRRERSRRQQLYAEFVTPGSLCFDIGANVGQSTESLIDCGARVVALEPNPVCHPALKWQFGRDHRVTIVGKGASSKPGELDLHVCGTDSRASVREGWFGGLNDSVRIPVTTLDDLIADYGKPSYCKVDVEGFEVEVFQGLTQPIRTISFEINSPELDRAEGVLAHCRGIDPTAEARLADAHQTAWTWDAWFPLEVTRQRLRESCPSLCNLFVRMPIA